MERSFQRSYAAGGEFKRIVALLRGKGGFALDRMPSGMSLFLESKIFGCLKYLYKRL